MKKIFLILTITWSFVTVAQKDYAKQILDTLCSDYYSGRGYVNDGVNKAADFLVNELKAIGVDSIPNQSYTQDYYFGVNTFPTAIEFKIGNIELTPGQDYLLHSNSGTAQGEFKTLEVNSDNFLNIDPQPKDKKSIVIFKFTNLKNRDSIGYFYGLALKAVKYAPVIWIQNTKKMYSVGRSSFEYPMIILDGSAYTESTTISLKVNNKYIPKFKNQNIIGYIPPAKKKMLCPEKYVVFSAHYDHLGQMGQAIFPGANDNASGVAMLLSLAKYYKQNPGEYGIVFCFFSGEEAGLEGSKYFVNHPYFKLKRVKFVLNIDIMGGASKGITVVNGSKHQKQFDMLSQINKESSYLNEVNRRGPTSNSDHYYFSKYGVPAFFIYSGGIVKNYHDIYDTAENTPLNKFDEVQILLQDFVKKL